MDLARLGLEIDSRGYVKATRDGDRFTASAARAEKSTEKLAKQARQMGRAFALAAAAGIAIAIRQLRVITREADRIQKLTIQTGLSAESLQRLGFAAEQAGSNMESMARANLLLQRNIQGARDGLMTQTRALDRIGVSLTDLKNLNPEQQFLHIADALSKITDPTTRNASAFELFGRSAQDLLPLLSAGGKEIADLGKQLEATGAMMSTDMVHAAARFNDIMNRLQLQIKGISVQLADGMMPILEATAELFLKTAGDADTLTNAGTKLAQGLNVLIRAAVVVQTTFKVAGEAIAAQATIAVGALQVMLAPIEAFTNALMGMAAALKDGDFRGARDAVRGLGEDMNNLANEGMLRMQEGMKGFSQEIPKIVQGAAEMLGKLESAVHATNKEIEETAAVTSAAAEVFSAEFEKSLTQLAASMGGEVARAQQAFNDQVEAATVLLKENEIGAGQHTRAIALYRQELDRIVNGAHKAFLDQIQDIEDELSGPAARAQTQFNRLIKEADDLLAGGTITLDHHTRAIAAYQAQLHAASGVGTTFGIDFDFIFAGLDQVMDQMYEIAQIDWEIDNLTDSFDPLIGQMRRLGEEIALIDRALNKNLISEAQAGFLKTGVTANAAFGAIMSGMDQSSKEYRQMEIAQQAVNVAMGIAAILQQGTGDPYTAIPRMIAMAAMVASLVGSIGGLSGGGGGAASRQQQQGTGSVLGDPGAQSESIVRATEITASATESLVGINQSMLRALQSMNDAITGASTSIARGGFGDMDLPTIGTSIGQFGPGLGFKIDDWLGGLFGFNKTKLRDEGIALFSGTISEIIDQGIGQAFSEVRRKGLFGSKTKTGFGDLAGDVTGQIELLLNSMVDAVSAGAAALGISQAEIERAIDSFHIQAQQISLMDLSPADQQAALEAVFSSIFDGLAGAVVPFIGQFQKVGEGLGETLIRVATGVQVTQEAMKRLGFTLDETDPQRFAQASEGLLAMTGGIDGLIAGMDNFINKFASDAIKFEIAQSDITRAMEHAGLELPATADGFWELMQTLDATTEEGQRQIATLLMLADAAGVYYDHLERVQSERERLERRELELMGDTAALRALELEKLDESNRGIQERIWSLEAEAAVASERAGLDRRLLELQGDTAAIRALELEKLDESNRAIQERIWRLEEEAAVSSEKAGLVRQLQEALGMTAQIREAELAALDESNRAIQGLIWRIQDELAIRAERADLERRELELLGDTVAIRALELEKLDESNRALQLHIWTLEEAAEAAAKAAAVASERDGLERQLLQLQGDTAAIRELELAALDESNRHLLGRIFALQDEQEAARAAAEAERELAAERDRIANEALGLERRILELTGDTTAIRELELAALDESNRHLLERIWALEAEAEAARAAAEAERELAAERDRIANEAAGLDRRIFELMGDTSAIRELELAALDESNRHLLERIWALEEEAEAARAAAEAERELAEERERVANEALGLERRILELMGDTAAIRELELAAVDESNRHLLERIWALEAEAEAAAKAVAIASERDDLERRILELMGDTAAIRELELAALDESNRHLLERIWALEAEAAAAAAAAAIADERAGLERRILELQGDTAAIRELELAALDESNHELQQRIWLLEDEIALAGLMDDAGMAFLQAVAPAVASLKQLVDRWVEMEEAATALGATEEQLFRIRRAARAELNRWISDMTLSTLQLAEDFFSVDQAFSQVGSSITSTVRNMRDLALRALGSIDDWLMKSQLSNVSPLTPTERLGEAESQFMSAFAAAMGGDFGALADLPGLADAFLGEAGGFFGTSTDQFRDIWDMVRAMMSQAADIEPPPEMQPVNAGQMNTLIETNSRFGEEIEALNLEMRAWQLADKINALAIAQGKTAAEIAEALGFTDQDMMQILTSLGEDIPHGTEISLRDHFNDVVGELAAQNPIVEAMKETTSDLSDTMIFMAGVIEANLWSIGDVLVQILEQLGGEFVPSFAEGGPVNHNGLANVHSGEFVVPRDGALISSGPDMSEVKQELSRISRLMERGNSDRRDGLGAVVTEARSTRRSIERKTETVRAA